MITAWGACPGPRHRYQCVHHVMCSFSARRKLPKMKASAIDRGLIFQLSLYSTKLLRWQTKNREHCPGLAVSSTERGAWIGNLTHGWGLAGRATAALTTTGRMTRLLSHKQAQRRLASRNVPRP